MGIMARLLIISQPKAGWSSHQNHSQQIIIRFTICALVENGSPNNRIQMEVPLHTILVQSHRVAFAVS